MFLGNHKGMRGRGDVCCPPKVLLFRKKFPNMEEEISKKNLATFPILFFSGDYKRMREGGDGGIFTIPPAPGRVKNDKKINWSQFSDLYQYQYTPRENAYQTVTNVISAANLSIKKTYWNVTFYLSYATLLWKLGCLHIIIIFHHHKILPKLDSRAKEGFFHISFTHNHVFASSCRRIFATS